jgi:flagella basal body P-ring formation protein FlgA
MLVCQVGKVLIGLCVCLASVTTAQAMTVESLATQWMYHTYGLDTSSYEIEVLSGPFELEDLSDIELDIRPLTQTEPLGLFTVLVEATKNGTVIKRGQVRMRIRKYDEVLVTADRLNRHDAITEDNVEIKRMEVTSLREQPFGSLEELAGFRMQRNLGRGKILTSGAVEPIPDIDVGQEVTILYSEGLFSITAPGRSLQAGLRGEEIRVKNTASGKVVSGRIVDNNAVAVGPLDE